MYLKVIRPTTPSRRHLIQVSNKKNYLKKKPILKSQILGLKNSSGRNNSGKITVRHKGGGHKRRYRKINFYRNYNENLRGLITSIEYDPNRTASIASVFELDKKSYFYILAPLGLQVGDVVKNCIEYGKKPVNNKKSYSIKKPVPELNLGYVASLKRIPEKLAIHNLALSANEPAKLTRAAGTFSYIIEKVSGYCLVKLCSGKLLLMPSNGLATIGTVSNDLHNLSVTGKAGRSRWLNKRPAVRGIAMNPVDHPNGGGEGKKSGKGFITPWGKPKKN